MGGSGTEEFIYPSEVGEDTFVRSEGGYAANVEAFTTAVPDAVAFDDAPEATIFDSPDTPTIETLVAHSNAVLEGEYTAADTLKNVVLALTHLDGTRELVVVGLPGDRDIDEKRAEVALTYIFGVGRTTASKALAETGVDPSTRVKDLSDDQLEKIAADVLANTVIEDFEVVAIAAAARPVA